MDKLNMNQLQKKASYEKFHYDEVTQSIDLFLIKFELLFFFWFLFYS